MLLNQLHYRIKSTCCIDNPSNNSKPHPNFAFSSKKANNNDLNQFFFCSEAFMAAVSKDAEERRRDREIRKEKSETLRVQAQKAFRRGEFEKAFCCYEKVTLILCVIK